jgi:hypothetical protein
MCLPLHHPVNIGHHFTGKTITNCPVVIRRPGVGDVEVKPTDRMWLMRNNYHLRGPLRRFATDSPIMQNSAMHCTIRRAGRARIQLWEPNQKIAEGAERVEVGPTGVKLSLP